MSESIQSPPEKALQKTRKELLQAIPGDTGLPFFGDLFAFYKDPIGLTATKKAKYGEVFKGRFWGRDQVTLLGKEANKFLLVEQSKYVSSQKAWELNLESLFPNGLMLMDGERHQYHRSILRTAFQKDPLNGYMALMLPIIEEFVEKTRSKNQIIAFHEIKNSPYTLQAKCSLAFPFQRT